MIADNDQGRALAGEADIVNVGAILTGNPQLALDAVLEGLASALIIVDPHDVIAAAEQHDGHPLDALDVDDIVGEVVDRGLVTGADGRDTGMRAIDMEAVVAGRERQLQFLEARVDDAGIHAQTGDRGLGKLPAAVGSAIRIVANHQQVVAVTGIDDKLTDGQAVQAARHDLDRRRIVRRVADVDLVVAEAGGDDGLAGDGLDLDDIVAAIGIDGHLVAQVGRLDGEVVGLVAEIEVDIGQADIGDHAAEAEASDRGAGQFAGRRDRRVAGLVEIHGVEIDVVTVDRQAFTVDEHRRRDDIQNATDVVALVARIRVEAEVDGIVAVSAVDIQRHMGRADRDIVIAVARIDLDRLDPRIEHRDRRGEQVGTTRQRRIDGLDPALDRRHMTDNEAL